MLIKRQSLRGNRADLSRIPMGYPLHTAEHVSLELANEEIVSPSNLRIEHQNIVTQPRGRSRHIFTFSTCSEMAACDSCVEENIQTVKKILPQKQRVITVTADWNLLMVGLAKERRSMNCAICEPSERARHSWALRKWVTCLYDSIDNWGNFSHLYHKQFTELER